MTKFSFIMEDTSNGQIAKPKKIVDRSAAYPAIPIETALKFVAEVYKNFRNEFAKRDDIINLIEGSHFRHVAASSYYGLLSRNKDSYQVSDLYKQIANPLSDLERQKGLLSAFGSPKLNKELIEKFDGGELPSELVVHLHRFHHITEDAAPLAAEVFIKNAKFCGVLKEDNIFSFKVTDTNINDPVTGKYLATVLKNNSNEDGTNRQQPHVDDLKRTIEEQKLLTEMVNEEKVKIRLTENKFAYLTYPIKLNKKDIAILQKQIEQLDLIIE